MGNEALGNLQLVTASGVHVNVLLCWRSVLLAIGLRGKYIGGPVPTTGEYESRLVLVAMLSSEKNQVVMLSLA